jgi:O-antigen/teichoic acid export membrane protein
MNTTQKILKNTLSLLMSGLLAQLLGFIVIVYLARVLAPEDFGKVSFALAVVTYFTLIVNMGLPLLGTRETARDLGKIKIYAGNILTMRLCLAAISFGLLLLMTFFLNKSPEIKYLIILYGLGLIPSALLLDWAFQGIEKMEYIGIGRILSRLVYLGLVIWFVKNPRQLLFIPCFQVIGSLLGAGVLFLIFLHGFGKPKCRFDLNLWKSLLKPALPIGASILMIQIIYNIDMVMLGFMRSNAEVGYYSAAYKIILPLIMAGAVYFDAIFPVISNYYNTSLDLLKKIQSYSARIIVSIALPLGVGGTILAKPIMNFVYGSKYNDGIIAFKVLIWVVAMIYMNCIYARGMWACNKQKEYLIIVTIQALTNIGLNLILIPSIGIAGAALSTVSAEILGFFFYYREFNKVVTVTIHNHIQRPLLAVIPMALGLLWGLNKLNMNVFLLIFTGIVVYFGFLLLLKDISRNEIKLIYNLLVTNQKQK